MNIIMKRLIITQNNVLCVGCSLTIEDEKGVITSPGYSHDPPTSLKIPQKCVFKIKGGINYLDKYDFGIHYLDSLKVRMIFHSKSHNDNMIL